MDIGVFLQPPTVDKAVQQFRTAADAGFRSGWMPQAFGIDALSSLAVVGREVRGIDLGTSVVPTFPRHPTMLAAQALTVQQSSGGRLTLGIGLSHQFVMEDLLGLTWDRPVRHLREYLSILLPLVRGEAAGVAGETLAANIALDIADAAPVPVLVAALGPQLLTVAGRMAEGTITWMTGPETIRRHIRPTIRRAASEAGRPEPQVVCALPVCVTGDEDAAREQAASRFALSGQLPSYRAMLDREGVEGPADVAIIGDAGAVRAGIERVFEAGATKFVAIPFANREQTYDAVRSLL